MHSPATTAAQGAAIAAGLLMVAAAINAVLAEPVAAKAPPIIYQGDQLVRLKASMPVIGAFNEFNVNDDNPFIPWHDRDQQRDLIGGRRSGKNTPEKPVVRTPTKPPPLIYPRLTPGGTAPPAAIGLIGMDERAVLLVRNGDDATSIPVPIGGGLNGWVLVAIEDNNRAVWRNLDGLTVPLPIGPGTLTQTPPAAAADKDASAVKSTGKTDKDKKVVAPKNGKNADGKDSGKDGGGKKAVTPRRPRFTDPPPESPDKM